MRYIKMLKWAALIVAAAIIVAFLNYFLPSKDVVRIVGVDVKRVDVGVSQPASDGGNPGLSPTKDVRYINTVWPSRKPRVYRNEDTGWGFPWYFKFDSGNLQAEAQDSVATAENPRWFVVTHYGWRIEILSMFPNAVAIKEVPSPDHTSIPWFNIVFLSLLALLLIMIWRFIVRLRRRHIDPVIEDIQENIDDVVTGASEATEDVRSGIAGYIDRLTGRKRSRKQSGPSD